MSFFVAGMIYSLFFLYRILGQQLLFKGKHRDVNCAKFTVTYIENFASKVWSVRSLGRKKKGSRLRLCFRVVDDVPEKKRMDLWKQMSSSRWSFTCICEIFLPLNPSTTTIYARSGFYPSLRFTLSLQSAFTPGPQSAVRSLQSAVRSLPLTLTAVSLIVNLVPPPRTPKHDFLCYKL